jgi:crossover junction endodeoxyribonuclease RusA
MMLTLPYPPSVNRYYRRVGQRTLISKEGRDYRAAVIRLANTKTPIYGRLDVSVLLSPPDKRRRDLDNTLKALLDALQHAGVYLDDSQIDRLLVERSGVIKGGQAEVVIQSMEAAA